MGEGKSLPIRHGNSLPDLTVKNLTELRVGDLHSSGTARKVDSSGTWSHFDLPNIETVVLKWMITKGRNPEHRYSYFNSVLIFAIYHRRCIIAAGEGSKTLTVVSAPSVRGHPPVLPHVSPQDPVYIFIPIHSTCPIHLILLVSIT